LLTSVVEGLHVVDRAQEAVGVTSVNAFRGRTRRLLPEVGQGRSRWTGRLGTDKRARPTPTSVHAHACRSIFDVRQWA